MALFLVAGRGGLKKSTVILPVFNEAGVIKDVYERVCRFARSNPDFEFVFVDDGSTDQTSDVLKALIEKSTNGCSAMLSYRPNAGKGYAVRTGVEYAETDYVCFMDGDLAYSLDHLHQLVAYLEDHDVVAGSRSLDHQKQKNIQLLRRIMGWGFNGLARTLLGLPYRDTQAGLKGFRREAARRIFSMQRIRDFTFDVEVLYLARHLGYRVAEFPVRVSEDHVYKGSKVNLLKDPLRMFYNLVRIRIYGLLGKYDRIQPLKGNG